MRYNKEKRRGGERMRNKRFYAGFIKRAVCTGLFLGMLWGLSGCVKPGPAVQPAATKTPVPAPTETTAPLPTATPGITESITPTVGPTKPVPEVTATPEPEKTVTPALEVTVTPEPEVTPTPEPEEIPSPSPEPEPSPGPEPEVSPGPTSEPEVIPSPTPEPGTTAEPGPEATPTPEPEITVAPEPDYNALLQNGWQRTEDFFGCREIYFSGQFTETELIAEEGYYEYRYTKTGDTTASFSLIGETKMLQGFLDELAQKGTECEIKQEEESLYSYVYREDGMLVEGRVYACTVDEKEYRMRAELHYPEGIEGTFEGYDFYLR